MIQAKLVAPGLKQFNSGVAAGRDEANPNSSRLFGARNEDAAGGRSLGCAAGRKLCGQSISHDPHGK